MLLRTEGTPLAHVSITAFHASRESTLTHTRFSRLSLLAVGASDIFTLVQLAVVEAFKASREPHDFVFSSTDPRLGHLAQLDGAGFPLLLLQGQHSPDFLPERTVRGGHCI